MMAPESSSHMLFMLENLYREVPPHEALPSLFPV